MSVYYNEINVMINKLVKKFVPKKDELYTINGIEFSLSELLILKVIKTEKNCNIKLLHEILDLKYNYILRCINKMQMKDLIMKSPSAEDKRKKVICLTDVGEKVYSITEKNFQEKLSFIIKDLTVNEEKAVLKVLSRINQLTFK